MDNWVNNYTEIDCTSLQGYSNGIKCTLQSLYCVRDFGKELDEADKAVLLQEEPETYTEQNIQEIMVNIYGQDFVRYVPFTLNKCYRNYADYYMQVFGSWPTSSDSSYNLVKIEDCYERDRPDKMKFYEPNFYSFIIYNIEVHLPENDLRSPQVM